MAHENGETNDNDLQMLEKVESAPKMTTKSKKMATMPEDEINFQDSVSNNNNQNNYLETEEVEEVPKYPGKLPLELDLSDLAAALLQNNKK